MASALLSQSPMFHSRSLVLYLVGALALASGRPAAADSHSSHGKVDRAVRESLQQGVPTQSVIISVKPGYRDQLRKALQQHGDVVKSEHALIDAVDVDLHSVDIDELANQPWVESVASDSEVAASGWYRRDYSRYFERLQGTYRQSTYRSYGGQNPLRQTLGLPASVPVGTSVGSVGVAIIDSGIAPLDDFAGRITAFYDFTKGNGKASPPYDDYGHGTHIAG